MSKFQIHPHRAYLNSDICLINRGNNNIVVKDIVEGKQYEIPGFSNVSLRLSAGKHSFVLEGDEDIVENVFIEDAIKLGGSKKKNTYIFDGTPWIVMVMLDRSYFYNRDTGELYQEFDLTPNEIHFLTSDYLLFVTENDNTIFSLSSLSAEEVIGESSFLYSNNNYAVFSSIGSLILYNLKDLENRYTRIECKDYAIDKTSDVLYYSYESNWIHKKSLDESFAEIGQFIRNFRCFVGSQSVVYGNNPYNLHIMNICLNKSECLCSDIPVTKINRKEIWNNQTCDLSKNAKVNYYTANTELTVFERGECWLILYKTKHYSRFDGIVSDKTKYYLRRSDTGITYMESDSEMGVIEGKSFDCVKDKRGKGIIIFRNATCKEFEGEPVMSPSGYILIKQQDKSSKETVRKILIDPLKPSFIHYSDYSTENMFRRTGILMKQKDDKNIEFEDTENNRLFSGRNCEYLERVGCYRIYEENQDNIHSINGIVRKMPCTKDRLLAISGSFNCAVVLCEEGIVILKYQQELDEWVEYSYPFEPVVIDGNFNSNAFFCYDGDNIVYQKNGKEYFVYDINSGKESIFEFPGSIIRKSVNGYLPYMNFDSHRRPVYIDPITLANINYAAAGDFTFQSIDGRIQHISRYVKYYHKEKEMFLSKKEYDDYASRYDYECLDSMNICDPPIKKISERNEQVKKNRIEYLKLKGEDISKNSWLIENEVFFCKAKIFRLEYYIRERVDNKEIEIKMPKRLWFLNYVSYSYDNRYILFSGKFCDEGMALIYDVEEMKVIDMGKTNKLKAVWLGVFSRTGQVAFYDSTPNTYFLREPNNENLKIENRSFLSFSPSGKYIALSEQGYIPYRSGRSDWGHQPSVNVYIRHSDAPLKELACYSDHGDQIVGVIGSDRGNNVASAIFSKDDKKLMTVSKDGVVVVRNLHFDD